MGNEWIPAIVIIGVLLLTLDVTRRAFMELQQIEQEQHIKKEMLGLRAAKQPWVTVLVYGEEGRTLDKTLRQIQRSRYAQFDVVRSKKHTAAAYRTAYRKSRRGEIIVCVQAGDEIDKQCIKRAVAVRVLQASRGQRARQSWRVPIANAMSLESGLRGVVQRLRFALWAPPAPTIPAYSRQGLRAQTQIKIPREYSGLPRVLVGALFVASIVAGALLHTTLFLYGWLLFSLYLLVLIWFSRAARLGHNSSSNPTVYKKLQLSFAVPSALFLVPVAGFIEGIFQLSTRK